MTGERSHFCSSSSNRLVC